MTRIPRRNLWLVSAGLGLSCALLILPGRVGGVFLWTVSLATLFGFVVARTPITDAAAAVRRLGRLVGTGVVAGGVLLAAIFAVFEFLDLSQPNVAPSNLTLRRVAREASEGGGIGVILGALFGGLSWVLSLLEALWKRRRAAAIAAWSPWMALFAAVIPVLVFSAGSEAILANDDLVSGCSSSCTAFPLSVASRAFGVTIAASAMCGAGLLVRVDRSDRSRLRALGATVLGLSGALALLLSYTAYSTHLDGGFRWGWLGVHLDTLPGEGGLRGAQVEAKADALGHVLVVRPREGRMVRWRLSLAVFGTAEREKLVQRVRDAAEVEGR